MDHNYECPGELSNRIYICLGERIGWGDPSLLTNTERYFYTAVYVINSIEGDGVLDAIYNDPSLMKGAAIAFTRLGMYDMVAYMQWIERICCAHEEKIARYCALKQAEEWSEDDEAFASEITACRWFSEIENDFYEREKLHSPYEDLDEFARIHKEELHAEIG